MRCILLWVGPLEKPLKINIPQTGNLLFFLGGPGLRREPCQFLLDGVNWSTIYNFLKEQFLCFCLCCFKKTKPNQTQPDPTNPTKFLSLANQSPASRFLFCFGRRWIRHVWPRKRVACRGVQVVWWPRRPGEVRPQCVLVGVGLRIPNSGVVACEDKLDEVTKQKRLFFLLFGYRIHCIFEEWNMTFRFYQLRDEMDSPMMEPLRNWNQPVSDRMG